ncbi:PIN domain-containing protein [Ottowia sp.]|uniref:PIN domain-containing protein n=1 Tax=Ottowia sp. TaxID=1898956 RepID=UPI00262BB15B|nr:PIN domain-containing protein [Ottowia sp.]
MWVLDTNTISYYFRGEPQVVQRLQAQRPAEIGVPAIVVYELRYGLARLPPEAAAPRTAALNAFLRAVQTLPFDAACAEQAATLRAALEAQGQPIGPHDTLIAATAIAQQAPLVTRNVREFARVAGLRVVNWMEQAS